MDTKKKLAINQPREDLELRQSLSYFPYKTGTYLYGTTIRTDAGEWPGVGAGIFSGS
jgi:hypothetical protein